MIRNHLKIAFRNLSKYQFYAFINILGLGFGLATFLLIALYVWHELSYDQYHPNASQIYRVDVTGRLGEQFIKSAQSPAPLGPTLMQDFPEIKAYMRFRSQGSYLMKFEDRNFKQEKVIFADSTLFQVFGLKLLQGNPAEALSRPNSLLLTQAVAEKYFAEQDPMGKSLLLDNQTEYKITGVLEEIPTNTHFDFDVILSMVSLEESRTTQWGSMNFNTYFVLKDGVDAKNFEDKMNRHVVSNYFGPEIEKYVGMTWQEFLDAGNAFDYSFFPLKRIHLYSDKEDELAINSDIRYVWIFSIIGLFILLIACINFMNLSTARSAIRAKEIGVRKVVGAIRSNLVVQFLSESLLVSAIGLILAWVVVFFALPYFNDLSGKSFLLQDVFKPGFMVLSLVLGALTGLLAGSYPALFLSRFQPIKVLKGIFKLDHAKPHFRNVLVVFQFTISVLLICGTIVVYRQLHFIQHQKLGFEREQLLMINDVYALGSNVKAFKEKALTLPMVKQATVTGFLPVPSYRNTSSYFKGRQAELGNAILINNWTVDHDYVKTMNMKIVQGRDFSQEMPTDSLAVIVNEKLAGYYGEDCIGKELSGYHNNDSLVVYKIIGVVKDFNFESLRQNIEPLAFFLGQSNGNVTLRLQSDDFSGAINTIQGMWNEMAPGQPFSYAFMDEEFDLMYRTERRIGNIIGTFATLAIIIACIGLIGLSTFIAQQRTKEIGIRKVLGADSKGIVALLSRDFLKLVLVALVIALPLAWYFMDRWLQDFAYRISIEWWVFALAGLFSIAIAFLTVSIQSVKAAMSNPIESLRSE